MTTTVLQATSLADIAPRLALSIGSTFAWDRARVWDVEPESSTVRTIAEWTSERACVVGDALAHKYIAEVVRTREPQWVPELLDRSAATGLWIGIASDDYVLGVLELTSRTRRTLDDKQFAAISDISQEIGRFLATRKAERLTLEHERSARAVAYRATLEAQSRFRALFNSPAVGMVVYGAGGEITEANAMFAALLGYTRDEIAQMNWNDLVVADPSRGDDFRSLADGGNTPPFNVELTHRSGDSIPVIVSCASVDARREVIAFIIPGTRPYVAAATPVGQRIASAEGKMDVAIAQLASAKQQVENAQARIKSFLRQQPATSSQDREFLRIRRRDEAVESQRRFDALFSSSVISMTFAHRDGTIQDANEAFCTLVGYTRAEVTRLDWRAITPDAWPTADDNALGQLRTTGTVAPFETELTRKDGTCVPILLGATALDDGILTFIIDNTGRKLAEQALAQVNGELEQRVVSSQHELRTLARHVEAGTERQHAALSRDLHDVLGQELTGLRLDAAWVKRRLTSTQGDERNRLADMEARIDALVITVRHIATELRPKILDDLGLLAALDWQARAWEKRSGVAVELISAGCVEVDFERATAVFRIFQELLTNVARHAGARCVKARVWIDNSVLTLEVADDGRGIREKISGSLGLLGARERASSFGGSLEIVSAPDAGTSVTIRIPVEGTPCAS